MAPALTASFGGPVMTGTIGVLAVAAQVVIAFLHGGIAIERLPAGPVR